MRLQDFGERFAALQSVGISWIGVELHAVAFEKRLFSGQLAVGFIFAGQFTSGDFAGFDVRLVEGVDADDRTGHGCRDLPAEKLFADGVRILHGDPDDRLARFLQRFDSGILRAIGRGLEPEIREYAIRTVVFGRGHAFAVYRDDSFAAFY